MAVWWTPWPPGRPREHAAHPELSEWQFCKNPPPRSDRNLMSSKTTSFLQVHIIDPGSSCWKLGVLIYVRPIGLAALHPCIFHRSANSPIRGNWLFHPCFLGYVLVACQRRQGIHAVELKRERNRQPQPTANRWFEPSPPKPCRHGSYPRFWAIPLNELKLRQDRKTVTPEWI